MWGLKCFTFCYGLLQQAKSLLGYNMVNAISFASRFAWNKHNISAIPTLHKYYEDRGLNSNK
jgi:hypothetical protein